MAGEPNLLVGNLCPAQSLQSFLFRASTISEWVGKQLDCSFEKINLPSIMTSKAPVLFEPLSAVSKPVSFLTTMAKLAAMGL